jgi:hypothetical protein
MARTSQVNGRGDSCDAIADDCDVEHALHG